jgi:hypothetical protein
MNTIVGQATVIVSGEVANAAKELENIRGFITQMTARGEELKKLILENVEIGQDGYFDGRKVVAVNPRKNTRFDRKGVEASHPELTDLFAEFTTQTVSGVVETF